MPLKYQFRYSVGLPELRVPSSHPEPKRTPTPHIFFREIKLNVPTSLESERRKAMMLIHASEKDIRNFNEKHFRFARNTFNMQTEDLIRFVHQKTGRQTRAESCRDFSAFLNRCRTSLKVAHKDELKKMDAILNRSVSFEEMLEKCRDYLYKALNDHVDKYCLSFASEAQGKEIPCVLEYENNIVAWRRKINEGFEKLEEIQDQLKTHKGDSFEDYKKNYDNILYGMKVVLSIFPRISAPLKDWITADEAYSRKLQDAANNLIKRKLENTKEARKTQLRAGDAVHQMRQKTYNSKNVRKKLSHVVEEKKYLRKRELGLMEKQSNMEKSYKEKKGREESLYEDLYFERSYSPTQAKQLLADINKVQEEMLKLDKKLDFLKDNLGKVRTERKAAQKEIYRLQNIYERSVKNEEYLSQNVDRRERDAEKNEENIRDLKSKIDSITRIRAIKLHPDTLKRLYDDGYSPGRRFDLTDGFTEACKITAKGIGHKWPVLYARLPFRPTRDAALIKQDIEAFDISGQKRDQTTRDVAFKSLAKWKRLSSEASTNHLVETLRDIDMSRLARKIEKRIASLR
ncbi:hypothetical protein LOTGIDRAFT_172686 [Lottia gigantea]|uniref:Death domain-containing protein n=1 Tax=Lottia gigantea TaxID=225164 RepID=V4B608_LOTGI|nr:hypothetical protein LOTGIDRAFT_172686 [Lottia gigantea]ESP01512.1 hypothetical protein LOTGIDRAFT_172686 [Lottia gigantea]